VIQLAESSLTIVIGPPPTPNGDLHLGHIAGPYMGADVFRRYRLLFGETVLYVSGTDNSQTYVVGAARRAGLSPETLAAQSTAAIRTSIAAAAIEMDGFAPYDDGYAETVRDFLGALHDRGLFRSRTRMLPVNLTTGEVLVEGLIEGDCPHCLARSRGALCETCGLALRCEDLANPRCTYDSAAVVGYEEHTILVLPLEDYREQLTAFYSDEMLQRLRPKARRVITSALSKPLLDFPISYPLTWGIAAPYSEVEGQVFNAWAEGMPASIYCTAHAFSPPDRGRADFLWREPSTVVAYFLGIDNVYFWGITHLALLMAHEPAYTLPSQILSNQFYLLEDKKFSTSGRHVLSMTDLLQNYSTQAARFYLALSAPETVESTFNRGGFESVVSDNLIEPWNALHALLSFGGQPAQIQDADSERRIAVVRQAFMDSSSLEGFSLRDLAKLIAMHLERLLRTARTGRADLSTVTAEFSSLARLASPLLLLDGLTASFPPALHLAADRRPIEPDPLER